MKNKLIIAICWIVIILCILLPSIIAVALADGTGKIAPLKPENLKHAEVIIPREAYGALLPWKTFQFDDTPRPEFWNGYGVDPKGVNYYHYFNQYPCRYDFMKEEELCKMKYEQEIAQKVSIPEPTTIGLLGSAIVIFWILTKVKL